MQQNTTVEQHQKIMITKVLQKSDSYNLVVAPDWVHQGSFVSQNTDLI
jgi:hypothetical protein